MMVVTNKPPVDRGFGRLPAADPRDEHYPMRALLDPSASAVVPKTRHWSYFSHALDQGSTSQCVAYSWLHFLLSAPVAHGPNVEMRLRPNAYAERLYREAQRMDEWPGENYDGTSVRAGAKALQAQGRLSEYRWARTVDEMRLYVLQRGVLVFGTNWHVGMLDVNHLGYIEPTGSIVGGHAYALTGYSAERRAFRVLNSWGMSWGHKGRAWLHEDHAAFLLANDGEACSGTEVRVA